MRRDGTVVTERYPAWTPKSATTAVDTIGDLMMAWQRSPRLKKLTKSTQTTYDQALRRLSGMLEVPVRKVTRRDMLDQMFA